MVIRTLSLFSGVGGLDLAVRIALPQSRCVCFVEGEFAAAEVLAARMEDGTLDDAPIWSDVRTFDGRPWRGLVDGIVGGFPCQDLSVAGKRAGIDGKRSGLWTEYVRIIGEVRPRWIFIENVPGLLANEAMRRVLGDLSALGFDAEWTSVRASDVGAPHRRERVFILAVPSLRGRRELRKPSGGDGLADRGGGDVDDAMRGRHRKSEDEVPAGRDGAVDAKQSLAHSVSRASGERRAATSREEAGGRSHVGSTRSGNVLADSGDRLIPQPQRRPEKRDGTGPAGACLFPPGPGDIAAWLDVLVRKPWLRPAISQAEAESALRDVADGLASLVVNQRTDALRAAGNGVVALQGALAFRLLARRIEVEK